MVVKRFSEVDLHPSVVDNHMMGSIFEDLIRRLAEQSNEVMPFTDRDLEIRYSFGRMLLKRLSRDRSDRVEIDGDVDLEYYRLSRTGNASSSWRRERSAKSEGPPL